MNSIKVLIGFASILILYFIYGVVETIIWIKFAVLGSLLSIFFFSPSYDLLTNNFTKEDGIMLIIGSVYVAFYIIITHSTVKQFIVDFLQSIVIVSVISAGSDMIKNYLDKKVIKNV